MKLSTVVDIEVIVLLRAIKKGVITNWQRVERIKEAALDELEHSTQDAEHREELETACRDLGMF